MHLVSKALFLFLFMLFIVVPASKMVSNPWLGWLATGLGAALAVVLYDTAMKLLRRPPR